MRKPGRELASTAAAVIISLSAVACPAWADDVTNTNGNGGGSVGNSTGTVGNSTGSSGSAEKAGNDGRLNGSVSATARSGANPFQEAVGMYKDGNYHDAKAAFEKLTGSSEYGDLSRYYLGLTLQQQGQYKAARDEYSYLYYKAKDKTVRYKAWEGLKALTPQSGEPASGRTNKVAGKPAPGADAWVMPKEGYGRSGPPASQTLKIEIIPTSCSRRH